MDRRTWQATVHWLADSQIRLSDYHTFERRQLDSLICFCTQSVVLCCFTDIYEENPALQIIKLKENEVF